ncbi:esterase/lipase family protein [Bacillus suaedaesalsae]|uniref:GPI inositol-deacylase PGAP1-like alpha/beta domain-containing protein n=1 Tax=Bacillus suaedaesalsae TaxID=2810349 RepID=A0ABS2DHG3_9BACI|nr:hypothetical protein [Bacillus suaedaesalsae]MBM6617917.1 hypothetical protein [Bacillus suaedaesalsae]
MFKKMLLVFVTAFLLFPSFSHAGSFGKDNDPSGVPGQWYVGTTPSYVAPSKHPILYVHGLNSSSNTWWNENNMYDIAYQNGYETAFIDLYPTKNMWDNGYLLSQKIRDMYNYFGEKVVIVAHSKGGIDTQSALVHYGAYPYVARVITLSSPHYGSELADLAYSSSAGWLADIMGSKSDATYSLQTGYMRNFRSQTDSHANVNKSKFYTLAGTKWGSFGSSLYWGGLYLSSYGSNDGAVTVTSSRLPYSSELRVGDWNHTTIKTGSATFNLFKNYLNETIASTATITTQNAEAEPGASTFVRGGAAKGQKKESIFVESGVNSVTIDWMSDTENPSLLLNDPDNNSYTSFSTEMDTEFFNGAYHHSITIDNPTAGEWSVESKTDSTEHYLLHVTLDSEVNENLQVDIVGEEVKVDNKNKKLNVKTNMTIEYYKNGKLKQGKVIAKKNGESYKIPKLGEGVYNMTVEIDGKHNNETFKRTVIKSVYVDHTGKLYFE